MFLRIEKTIEVHKARRAALDRTNAYVDFLIKNPTIRSDDITHKWLLSINKAARHAAMVTLRFNRYLQRRVTGTEG